MSGQASQLHHQLIAVGDHFIALNTRNDDLVIHQLLSCCSVLYLCKSNINFGVVNVNLSVGVQTVDIQLSTIELDRVVGALADLYIVHQDQRGIGTGNHLDAAVDDSVLTNGQGAVGVECDDIAGSSLTAGQSHTSNIQGLATEADEAAVICVAQVEGTAGDLHNAIAELSIDHTAGVDVLGSSKGTAVDLHIGLVVSLCQDQAAVGNSSACSIEGTVIDDDLTGGCEHTALLDLAAVEGTIVDGQLGRGPATKDGANTLNCALCIGPAVEGTAIDGQLTAAAEDTAGSSSCGDHFATVKDTALDHDLRTGCHADNTGSAVYGNDLIVSILRLNNLQGAGHISCALNAGIDNSQFLAGCNLIDVSCIAVSNILLGYSTGNGVTVQVQNHVTGHNSRSVHSNIGLECPVAEGGQCRSIGPLCNHLNHTQSLTLGHNLVAGDCAGNQTVVHQLLGSISACQIGGEGLLQIGVGNVDLSLCTQVSHIDLDAVSQLQAGSLAGCDLHIAGQLYGLGSCDLHTACEVTATDIHIACSCIDIQSAVAGRNSVLGEGTAGDSNMAQSLNTTAGIVGSAADEGTAADGQGCIHTHDCATVAVTASELTAGDGHGCLVAVCVDRAAGTGCTTGSNLTAVNNQLIGGLDCATVSNLCNRSILVCCLVSGGPVAVDMATVNDHLTGSGNNTALAGSKDVVAVLILSGKANACTAVEHTTVDGDQRVTTAADSSTLAGSLLEALNDTAVDGHIAVSSDSAGSCNGVSSGNIGSIQDTTVDHHMALNIAIGGIDQTGSNHCILCHIGMVSGDDTLSIGVQVHNGQSHGCRYGVNLEIGHCILCDHTGNVITVQVQIQVATHSSVSIHNYITGQVVVAGNRQAGLGVPSCPVQHLCITASFLTLALGGMAIEAHCLTASQSLADHSDGSGRIGASEVSRCCLSCIYSCKVSSEDTSGGNDDICALLQGANLSLHAGIQEQALLIAHGDLSLAGDLHGVASADHGITGDLTAGNNKFYALIGSDDDVISTIDRGTLADLAACNSELTAGNIDVTAVTDTPTAGDLTAVDVQFAACDEDVTAVANSNVCEFSIVLVDLTVVSDLAAVDVNNTANVVDTAALRSSANLVLTGPGIPLFLIVLGAFLIHASVAFLAINQNSLEICLATLGTCGCQIQRCVHGVVNDLCAVVDIQGTVSALVICFDHDCTATTQVGDLTVDSTGISTAAQVQNTVVQDTEDTCTGALVFALVGSNIAVSIGNCKLGLYANTGNTAGLSLGGVQNRQSSSATNSKCIRLGCTVSKAVQVQNEVIGNVAAGRTPTGGELSLIISGQVVVICVVL